MKPTDPIDIPEPQKTSLVVHEARPQSISLFRTDDPVEVVTKASAVASALKAVIAKQGLISNIQGKQYPKCEAWTLCGTMLGIFPVLCWSKPVEHGWEARVEARTRDGAIIGAAEAECLRTEKNWKSRDDFALRSMAQTRATAKALRMPLGFIMTLAGYEATPMEEMPHDLPMEKRSELRGVEHAPRVSGVDNALSRSQQTPPLASSVKPASNRHRDKMIANLIAIFGDQNQIKEFAEKAGIILPTETLLDWPPRFVPNSAEQMNAMEKAVAYFMDGGEATKPFANDEPEAVLKDAKGKPLAKIVKGKGKVEVPRDSNLDPGSEVAAWRSFQVPFGKDKGTRLDKLDKNKLFGWWAGFECKATFEGKDGAEVQKSPSAIAKDKIFRCLTKQD